ncbi:MAG: MBL fold metallo-hydrolase [Paludibacteraceae bacterium]|nr:MBL fold metallo-hydrolase [Paludibacteraceae bacterium]
MELKVLNSGSKANGYVLQNDTEAIVIECGCPVSDCLQAVNFQSSKIVACLVSHEHGDHAKHIEKYMEYMPVYCSKGTAEAITYKSKRRPTVLRCFQKLVAGNFVIQTFDTQHDSAEPFGFVIEHPEIGKLLFATDTYYIKYKFDNLTNVMIECNYDKDILNENVYNGLLHPVVQERTIRSHMEIDTTIKTLKDNDASHLNQVVLLHLSGNNASPEEFQKRVSLAIGKCVSVAHKGLNLIVNKTPF